MIIAIKLNAINTKKGIKLVCVCNLGENDVYINESFPCCYAEFAFISSLTKFYYYTLVLSFNYIDNWLLDTYDCNLIYYFLNALGLVISNVKLESINLLAPFASSPNIEYYDIDCYLLMLLFSPSLY